MPVPVGELPATTSFPSDCNTSARPSSKPPAKSVVAIPPVPKLASSEPSALYRASAKSKKPEVVTANPAATSFASGCSTNAVASSSEPAKSVVTVPPVPKVGSSVPSAL